jgi:hypothetical protein
MVVPSPTNPFFGERFISWLRCKSPHKKVSKEVQKSPADLGG